MITHPFTYQAPPTLEEAVQALGRGGDDAKVIAGGYSLLPLMKLGLVQPESLVDLRRIAELGRIRTDGDGTIAIGALVTHRAINVAELRERLPALAEAAGAVGDLQVRARGTIGGSLAHADPAADEPAPTLAYDATIRAIGKAGKRDIAARDFFKGPFETALGPGEILVEVRFPPQPARTGGAYAKFAHPASRFAIVGVAAVVMLAADGTVDRAAIGVTGAGPSPYRATAAEKAITGTKADAKALAAAAAKAADGLSALADLAASSEYRKHLVTVYARRALVSALERARGA